MTLRGILLKLTSRLRTLQSNQPHLQNGVRRTSPGPTRLLQLYVLSPPIHRTSMSLNVSSIDQEDTLPHHNDKYCASREEHHTSRLPTSIYLRHHHCWRCYLAIAYRSQGYRLQLFAKTSLEQNFSPRPAVVAMLPIDRSSTSLENMM